MPYKLRKAPKRELYWVITTETGKKHSKEPIPKEKAQAQKRILEAELSGGGVFKDELRRRLERFEPSIQEEVFKRVAPELSKYHSKTKYYLGRILTPQQKQEIGELKANIVGQAVHEAGRLQEEFDNPSQLEVPWTEDAIDPITTDDIETGNIVNFIKKDRRQYWREGPLLEWEKKQSAAPGFRGIFEDPMGRQKYKRPEDIERRTIVRTGAKSEPEPGPKPSTRPKFQLTANQLKQKEKLRQKRIERGEIPADAPAPAPAPAVITGKRVSGFPGWEKFNDGIDTWYYNKTTKQSLWELPDPAKKPAPGQPFGLPLEPKPAPEIFVKENPLAKAQREKEQQKQRELYASKYLADQAEYENLSLNEQFLKIGQPITSNRAIYWRRKDGTLAPGYKVDALDPQYVVRIDDESAAGVGLGRKRRGKSKMNRGGVLGFVGKYSDMVQKDYTEAYKKNPTLPKLEDVRQHLNNKDLEWMVGVLSIYKTWDNYIQKAKGALTREVPANLANFLQKRNAFTGNLPKMKYYLDDISLLLRAIPKSQYDMAEEAEKPASKNAAKQQAAYINLRKVYDQLKASGLSDAQAKANGLYLAAKKAFESTMSGGRMCHKCGKERR